LSSRLIADRRAVGTVRSGSDDDDDVRQKPAASVRRTSYGACGAFVIGRRHRSTDEVRYAAAVSGPIDDKRATRRRCGNCWSRARQRSVRPYTAHSPLYSTRPTLAPGRPASRQQIIAAAELPRPDLEESTTSECSFPANLPRLLVPLDCRGPGEPSWRRRRRQQLHRPEDATQAAPATRWYLTSIPQLGRIGTQRKRDADRVACHGRS